MKIIKNFESFSIPIASKDDLTSYYSCEECNALWKEFNHDATTCKFCGSDEIEELDSEEYYELSKIRMEDDEIKDMEDERHADKDVFVNLLKLKTNKNVN